MPSQMDTNILNSTGEDFTISQFLLVWKTYFFELVLDGMSDFHQNWLR